MEKVSDISKLLTETKQLLKKFHDVYRLAKIGRLHRTPLNDLDRFDLNDEQEQIVSRNYKGSRRIQGASGSGKTVILIYRALRLANENPEHTIRIFTINHSLAVHLSSMMQILAKRKGMIPHNIHITSFYDFAKNCDKLFHDVDRQRRLADGKERFGDPDADDSSWRDFYREESRNEIFCRTDVKKLISHIERYRGQSNDACIYLWQEMNYIRSAMPKKDRQRYKDTGSFKRDTRSIPLNAIERALCLDILKDWEEWIEEADMCDIDGMTTLLAEHLDNEENRRKIVEKFSADYILVDEFQDFSTLEMSILNNLLGSDATKPNLFFMVGDLNQKVYSKHHHRGQAGFDFGGGRTWNMSQNYRNTREILQAALQIPKSFPPKTEDVATATIGQTVRIISGDTDVNITDIKLSPYAGGSPIIFCCDEENHAETIFQLVSSYYCRNISVAVVSENNRLLTEIKRMANREGIKWNELFRNNDLDRCIPQQADSFSNLFTLSRLDAVKGLEFNTVIAADMSDRVIPKRGTVEEEKWKEAAIVYAALTRAISELIITYTGRPSEFIEVMKEYVDWELGDDMSFMKRLLDG